MIANSHSNNSILFSLGKEYHKIKLVPAAASFSDILAIKVHALQTGKVRTSALSTVLRRLGSTAEEMKSVFILVFVLGLFCNAEAHAVITQGTEVGLSTIPLFMPVSPQSSPKSTILILVSVGLQKKKFQKHNLLTVS